MEWVLERLFRTGQTVRFATLDAGSDRAVCYVRRPRSRSSPYGLGVRGRGLVFSVSDLGWSRFSVFSREVFFVLTCSQFSVFSREVFFCSHLFSVLGFFTRSFFCVLVFSLVLG